MSRPSYLRHSKYSFKVPSLISEVYRRISIYYDVSHTGSCVVKLFIIRSVPKTYWPPMIGSYIERLCKYRYSFEVIPVLDVINKITHIRSFDFHTIFTNCTVKSFLKSNRLYYIMVSFILY